MRFVTKLRYSTALTFTFVGLSLGLLLTGCGSNPPRNTEDICALFAEKDEWFDDARDAQKKHGTPIHVMMAIMHQESRFVADAKTPRKRFLGIVPAGRKSSAFGYAQVKDETWDWYVKSSGNRWADRDDFADAIDFIGWYTVQSQKRLGISKWDPYAQYLAYHEGHGGYERKTYEGKQWLIDAARRVDWRAKEWGVHLRRCRP